MAEYFVDAGGTRDGSGYPVDEALSAALEYESRARLIEAEHNLMQLEQLGVEVKKRRAATAMESLRVGDIEFVNRWDYMPKEFGFGSHWGMSPFGGATLDTPSSRIDGRDEPFVISEVDLNYARGLARFVTRTHCPGVAIERNLKAYIVGRGGNYSAGVRKGNKVDPGLLDAVQDCIDEFADENKIVGGGEAEWLFRGIRDGETILFLAAMKAGQPGIADVRELEPANVRDPGRPLFSNEDLFRRFGQRIDVALDWTWGVVNAAHDVQKIYGYAVDWGAGELDEWDYLPERYIEHWKRNTDRNVSRGMSDFFPAAQWLKEQHRLLSNTSAGARERAAIAWVCQHATGVTQSQVLGLRQSMADYALTYRGPSGNQKTYYPESHPPGTKLDVEKGREYISIAQGADPSPAYIEVIQAIARHVGSMWCLPEGYSGDDSNNNFASSITAGSRFEKFASMEQGSFAQFMGRILWKMLGFAFSQGRFARWGYGPGGKSFYGLKRLIEIVVAFPDVAARDPAEQATVREVMHRNGILSKKTWRDQVHLDHETEEANIRSEGGPPSQQPMNQFGAPFAQQVSESVAHDAGKRLGRVLERFEQAADVIVERAGKKLAKKKSVAETLAEIESLNWASYLVADDEEGKSDDQEAKKDGGEPDEGTAT